MTVNIDMISDEDDTPLTTTTTIESSQSELKKLTKDKLLKICKKDKIRASKSFRKDELIQSILDFHCKPDLIIPSQEDVVDTTPKSNHSMNEFNSDSAEYSLPTTTIIKILRRCWILRLQSEDIKNRYREALQLTSINKQFHAIVGISIKKDWRELLPIL
ncbi:hypothetical protein PPL_05433 [Heterostelium album PN500]|uniref:Uncharacterized protein n=1 Tax=Heterostelium pallidum (strain ATCC 26659 / Pp 5 / PN500) TaxID=670386 RepID=D3BA58_HETP5|nr:hypothetical protein PPL_05433 [Heterostelium album PN500]EFA81445.1 hypothetical protein PPL_05433 [Heterostelium album PN500]|eukprot:XP_020433563.1 hypothetical protein PPL_05433 [Heterostelium album PN500]